MSPSTLIAQRLRGTEGADRSGNLPFMQINCVFVQGTWLPVRSCLSFADDPKKRSVLAASLAPTFRHFSKTSGVDLRLLELLSTSTPGSLFHDRLMRSSWCPSMARRSPPAN